MASKTWHWGHGPLPTGIFQGQGPGQIPVGGQEQTPEADDIFKKPYDMSSKRNV